MSYLSADSSLQIVFWQLSDEVALTSWVESQLITAQAVGFFGCLYNYTTPQNYPSTAVAFSNLVWNLVK